MASAKLKLKLRIKTRFGYMKALYVVYFLSEIGLIDLDKGINFVCKYFTKIVVDKKLSA